MSSTITDIYGRIILVIFVMAVLLAAARAAFAAPEVTTPAQAIEQAVALRIGDQGQVRAGVIATAVAPEPGLRAQPEPGARTGQPARFVLLAGQTRRGTAVATVSVNGVYARAARAVERDALISAEDVELVDGEWPAVSFTHLPSPDAVVGLQARRAIAPGEMFTNVVLDVPALVRAGEDVEMAATVGSVLVTGEGIASSSGQRGDIIRVRQKPNGRTVRARILGQRRVEVVQ